MVKDILTSAGFVENETYRETQFLTPPREKTYAIYLDSMDSRGADNINLIEDHSVTVELYEYYPDNDAEVRLETVLSKRGIEFHKEARYWLETEQLYQVIYTFDYTIKGA